MHKLLLLAGLLLSYAGQAQELAFDVRTRKLAYYLTQERGAGSRPVPVTSRHIVPTGVAQPLVFQRPQAELPPLTTSYFFTQADSSIHYVLYEWDASTTGQQPLTLPIAPAAKRAFLAKYRTLTDQLTARYGAPDRSTGSLPSPADLPMGGINRQDYWRAADSTTLDLSLVLSDRFEQKGTMTTVPTYRLRLYVNNPTALPQPGAQMLSAAALASYSAAAQGFVKALQTIRLVQARQYLSTTIKASITDQQLTMLAGQLRPHDALVLVFSGMQVASDGNVYPLLQFRYQSDPATPPTESWQFFFDKDGKILGTQLLRAQKQP